MKVGVITFHSAFNYGASLQTWALSQVLKSLGMTPYVINYHPEAIDKLYTPPALDTVKKKKKYLFKKGYRKSVLIQREKSERYIKFIKERFPLLGDFKTYDELLADCPELDAYITGSDQVWNTDHTNGFDPAYLLDFAKPGKKVISYAASVGREYILPMYKEQFKESLKKFTSVSIREKSSQKAVQEICTQPVSVVLDPTLLLTRNDYDELKKPGQYKGRYIFVYMMEMNKDMVRFVNRLSTAMGLPVIQRRSRTVFKNELGSYFLDTPSEFLGEIEGAELVVTNSFHATVFSMLYEKPFVSMLHSETGARTKDLLDSVGLSSHILTDPDTFHDMHQFEINDKKALKERLSELRKESLAFLKQALGQL